MKRTIRWYDYITINIYWLGLTTVSQSNGLIVPLLVQKFVGPEQQGTAFGRLRLYTLMVALLAQALMGMLSDRSTLRWGRRRPFILVGTLLNMACMIAIGASPGYWFLFGTVVLSQIASNIAHGAEQGLIPDLVPEDRRGRFSGAKSIMELLPVILVAFTVGPLVAAGQMWAGILVATGILFLCMAITLLVREEPLREPPGHLDWEPFGRLVAMTLVFMLVILGLGEIVKGIGKLLGDVDSVSISLIVMGGAGLLAMAAAVVGGVWASVRISIGGKKARQYPSFTWWVINRLAFLVGTANLSGFAVYFLQARLGLEGEAAAGPASQLMMVVGILILMYALPLGWLADLTGRKRWVALGGIAILITAALLGMGMMFSMPCGWLVTSSLIIFVLMAVILALSPTLFARRKWLVALSGITAAVGTLVLVLAPNLAVIYAGGCIIGAATGTFFTTNWALGTDVVPKEEAGRYLGISNLAGAGAGAVGAYIGGPIADYFTVRVPQFPGLGYLLIFAIYGVLFLLSAIVLIRVREVWSAGQEQTSST